MAEISWIKLKTEMFSDDKIRLIESMPEADAILVIWIKLLCQAGKTNANGYIYLNENVPFSPEMLCTLFNRPLTVIKLALKTLCDFGMIAIDQQGRISIENWLKHQNTEGLEKIREQNRERARKFRLSQKLLLSNRTDKKELEEEINKELDIESTVINNVTYNVTQFTTFWNEYPKKINRKGCEKKFKSICTDEIIFKKMMEAVAKQKQSNQWSKDDGQYIPNPLTWLNQRRWEDEIQTLNNGEKNGSNNTALSAEANRNRFSKENIESSRYHSS